MHLDPRGQRFAATLSTLVLAAARLTPDGRLPLVFATSSVSGKVTP